MIAILLFISMSGCNKNNHDSSGTGLPSVIPPPTGSTQAPVSLGSIYGGGANFAVLAHTTVTSVGLTHVNGDLGVFPGTAVTGFGPGVVSGTIYAGVAPADAAQSSLTGLQRCLSTADAT
jgi:hypothetical protein